MAVALRLMRFGKRANPTYRIVVLDKRKKRDGFYLEKVGIYNPMSEPAILELNEERLSYWLSNGASVSEGMQKILKNKLKKAAPKKAKLSKKAQAKAKAAAEASKKAEETPAQEPAETQAAPAETSPAAETTKE